MKNYSFVPDVMYDSVFEITPEALLSRGIRAVVLDIDNTLVTYGVAEPTDEVIAWIDTLKQAGLSVAIASNNHEPRVALFNKKLGVFTTWESKKPFARAVRAACAHFGVTERETAVIGDQIFTDVWCARNAGALAILVKPIPYPENLFFKCKRVLEKPFIRAYRRRHNLK
ncbi:MAG: YqeG family HAD IIIA-type phosphatase [Clostridia bacterium]|nr:YqeG family HAD IIIA-type phosphatase [Clostridia bacterium]